ncbi:MAG: FHA domain-containing protein [Bdellovibrionales bacterium]|nr:FHA domain-containing protein [Bdellovibrionales bacterium]
MVESQERSRLPEGLGAIIVFTEGSEKGRQFPLMYVRTLVGRTKGDILVRDWAVSSKHLAIDYRRGKFHIVDNDSKNGTFVNGKQVRDRHIFVDQSVRIGDSLFHIELDPDRYKTLVEQKSFLVSPQRGLKELIRDEFFNVSLDETKHTVSIKDQKDIKKYIKVRVLLPSGKNIKLKYMNYKVYIGREDTELILQDIEVSRKHAYLERLESNQVILYDLASANGTFVNEKRIERKVLMKEDVIRVGKTKIEYLGVFQ